MKEHPILFSAPMIRAILDDRKSQTRRIVKGAECWHPDTRTVKIVGVGDDGIAAMPCDEHGRMLGGAIRCPYGPPGDRLWVRETFFAWGRWETRFSVKKGRDEWHFIDMTLECEKDYLYAADGVSNTQAFIKRRSDVTPMYWQRPSIHMPRVASRIQLEVTAVRVERLNDISEADAMAEGAPPSHPSIDRISREFGYADFSRSWYAQL